jgi:hypothetical protein
LALSQPPWVGATPMIRSCADGDQPNVNGPTIGGTTSEYPGE